MNSQRFSTNCATSYGAAMRILVVGAGGVGSAVAAVARRRAFFERMTLVDLDVRRAEAAVAPLDDKRFASAGVDASDPEALASAIAASGADVVLNATDPRFNPSIFDAVFDAGCTYLDMALTFASPHPQRPYEEPHVKLGDAQFAEPERWLERGVLALVGMGVEPGLSDVFARYAAD